MGALWLLILKMMEEERKEEENIPIHNTNIDEIFPSGWFIILVIIVNLIFVAICWEIAKYI